MALAGLGRASLMLWRYRGQEWVRSHGHPFARLLLPAPAYLRFDKTLAVTVLLADLWLVSGIVVLGSDGIFTEEWMGYPGMMDPGGQGYQAGAVSMLLTTAWWSASAAVLGRCWTTAVVQLTVLPLPALWIASFDTYYT
ncbi:hypothetical protein [Streptomyces sp. NBC_01443]|uniref:hypothetical protein n=1 Tax=Streptomyces sp. NBC_01443 TaxID=2903868 RepID=UPI00224D620A|nr:hypothetical protein [Streptomyces sp. NBC_01443]MCX4632200.1 hypothetical protein [Streptomyces sp. NBC_01443]